MNKEKNVGVSPLLGTPNAKLGFIIKDGTVTIKKLAAEVLNLIYGSGGGGGGGIVQLIDLSDRMTGDNTTVTDMEVKTSLFLYNVYDRVSGIARVVEPETEDRYLLFKVCCYEGNENKILYVAYTTEDDFSANATWHYYKTIGAEDALYPWAMSVFGDAVVNVNDNLLKIGNVWYTLDRYVGQDVITYEYSTPVITEFSYSKVSSNGDAVYPTVLFEQDITRIVTNSAGSTRTALELTGKFTEGNKFDYNDYGLATLVGNGAVFMFTGNNPNITGGVDTTGKVVLGPSDNINERSTRTVTAVVFVNGETSESKYADVWQFGASIDEPKTVNVSGNGVSKQITTFSKTAGVTIEGVTSNVNWITDINVNVKDTEVSIQYTVGANSGDGSRSGVISIATDVAGLSTSLTVVQGVKEAAIIVNGNSVKFGENNVGGTYYSTVTVTGINISENISVSRTGNDAFSVDVTSISPAQAISGYRLEIAFSPVNTGAVTGSIVLTSGSATATITLSGTGKSVAPTPEHIIGYYGKGSTLPTELGSNTFIVTNGMKHHNDGGENYIWIALPTSLNAVVNGTGILGAAFDVHNDHIIGSYTVYYRKTVVPTGLTDFTITF